MSQTAQSSLVPEKQTPNLKRGTDIVWGEVAIGDICHLVNGRAFKPTEWTDTGLPIIRIQNLNDEGKPFNYYNGTFDPKHEVNDGDGLISWSGTPGTSFGAFIWTRGQAVLNQHIFRAELNEDWVDKKFFVYGVNWRLEELIRRAHGGVGLRHITKSELEAVTLRLPYPDDPAHSPDIQRRIVARIEALMAEVKEARALAAAIRRDADRLLAAAVHEVFISLHAVANIVPLKETATAFNGRASGEGSSTVRALKTKHVYPHCLRLDRPSYIKTEQVRQIPKDRYLKPGDVLMANIAEGTLGRVTYVHECKESWTVDTQVMILRSLDERNLLLGKWLYSYLWSERGQQEILTRRSGIAFADKRGQTHIYPKNVLEIPVPVPPIEQQTQAVAFLDNVQTETEEMRRLQAQDTELLDQLEQSILERAFRGKL